MYLAQYCPDFTKSLLVGTEACSVKSILVQTIYSFPVAIFVSFFHIVHFGKGCAVVLNKVSRSKIRVESNGLEKPENIPYNISPMLYLANASQAEYCVVTLNKVSMSNVKVSRFL